MKAKTPKEVLIAAKWIINNVGWCQESLVRDKQGAWMDLIPPTPSNPDVAKVGAVCLYGSLALVETDEPIRDQATDLVRETLDDYRLSVFNDASGRTKKQVIALINKAIRKAT